MDQENKVCLRNSGLVDETTIAMLRAFRNGVFIGNGTPIPVSKYIENKTGSPSLENIQWRGAFLRLWTAVLMFRQIPYISLLNE